MLLGGCVWAAAVSQPTIDMADIFVSELLTVDMVARLKFLTLALSWS